MSSSHSSNLISHPHQTLQKHLYEVDRISRQALSKKYVATALGGSDQIERWRQLLVYFHDFGKSTVFFQHKILQAVFQDNPSYANVPEDYIKTFYQQNNARELSDVLKNFPSYGFHATLGAFVVQENLKNDDLLIRAIIFEIIKRHHGDLENFCIDEFTVDRDIISKQWENSDRTDYERLLAELSFTLPDNIQPYLDQLDGARLCFKLDATKKLPSESLHPYATTLFLFSLLLAADKGDMMLGDRDNLGEVKLFDKQLVDNYKTHIFARRNQSQIDTLREEAYKSVAENVSKHTQHAFFSITLPTGLGKTFTAFNAALKLQNELALTYSESGFSAIPKIIYCLPFTSVIDQNARILEEIFYHSGMQEGYLARHHYLSDWPSRFSGRDDLNDTEKEYFTEGWEYPFIVTTFVQLLETIFSNKNRKLRKFHNIANAIIILDEVQNIPPKYFETVEATFQSLFECFGTRFIFVTATQPLMIIKNPVIELTDPRRIATRGFFQNMNRIELDISLWKQGEKDWEELFSVFQDAVDTEAEKSFLFIVNKVKDSQDLYTYLKEKNPGAKMVYLSAAILPQLRKDLIRAIKEHDGSKQLLVVTTQVVEAGVDIDLDIVYRDFAPLDSINQSAGRCNRNGIKGLGQVRLFASAKGTVNVYDSVLINITKRVLVQQVKEGTDSILESAFFDLNERYAYEIRKGIADESDHSKLIGWMKNLQFANVAKHFELIDSVKNRYSVFIDYDERSHEIWQEYLSVKTIEDRWNRKKEMRKLRPKILQYVVQFPEKCLPAEKIDEEKPIIYLGPNEFSQYYSLETGYGIYSAPETNQALVL